MALSFFLRDQQVLERAVENVLPSLAGRSHPRIRDAGAAMGQEPYTRSTLFGERMGHFAFDNLRMEYFEPDGKADHFRMALLIRSAATSGCRNRGGWPRETYRPSEGESESRNLAPVTA